MCGLIGAVARRDVMPLLFDGLQQMEYLNYESVGIGFLYGQNRLNVRRCLGRIGDLRTAFAEEGLSSPIGIAHTRSRTPDLPDRRNAHPHVSHKDIAVVHNGTITNGDFLRGVLATAGYRYRTETDTEVIAHLIHHQRRIYGTLFEAVRATVPLLTGEFAFVVMAASEPDRLVAGRCNSPLVLGTSRTGHYAASDISALQNLTGRFVLPENGDVAELRADTLRIVDAAGLPVTRPARIFELPERATAINEGPDSEGTPDVRIVPARPAAMLVD